MGYAQDTPEICLRGAGDGPEMCQDWAWGSARECIKIA